MIGKIIVPLDGSSLSEAALPYAVKLARQLKVGLTLLKVEESQPETGLNSHTARTIAPQAQTQSTTALLEKPENSEVYLQQVKTRLSRPGVDFSLPFEQIETRVEYGKSPKELAKIIKEMNGDLVVMTTHGRSGLSLLMMGSIATNFIHNTNIPVILIKTDGSAVEKTTTTGAAEPIVVTLDGTTDSEAILETASNLALQLGVELHLLEVVNVTIPDASGQLYIPAEYDPDTECAQLKIQAESYLNKLQVGLQAKGIDCITSVLTGEPFIGLGYNPEPVFKIIEYAHTEKAQFVAMATHARSRFGQVMLGSISEEEVRQSPLPVMLVRTGEPQKYKSGN